MIQNKIGANDEIDLDELLRFGFIEIWEEEGEEEKLNWGSRYIPKDIKQAVWERDGGKCQAKECQATENIEYDHIIPVSKGGGSTLENLQLLCRSCNRSKRVRSTNHICAEQDATQKRSLEGERETEGETECLSSKPSGDSTPSCPIQKIIDIYRSTARRLRSCREVSETTKGNIRARWRSSPKYQNLMFWEHFFNYAENNRFLSGQSDPRPGQEPFVASLQWLVKPQNFAKVVNEEYS